MSFRLRYRDIWPEFVPEEFLFTQVIQEIVASDVEIVRDLGADVDLEISSVFAFESMLEKLVLRLRGFMDAEKMQEYVARATFGYRLEVSRTARRHIWYTGENRRYPTARFDGTLSFDRSDPDTNNLYFPDWMLELDWGFRQDSSKKGPIPRDLTMKRDPLPRPLSACAFSSNREPMRERIVEVVGSVLPFTGYGKRYGNRVSSKADVAKNFGFQVCNENSLAPGYVTEKLQEAWMSHNIPIWSGLHSDNNFNPDAFLNVTSKTNHEIQNMLNNFSEQDMQEMQSEPLMIVEPTLNPLRNFFAELIS